jgi:drug/metabolite transporter (DMT)-like permease
VGILGNAGILAILSLAVSLAPLVMGLIYAIRPTEGRLALMRPLSLAGIFSALTGFCIGIINVLVGVSSSSIPLMEERGWLVGASEALVSLFVGFGCLTVAWLCVTLGMRRQSSM